MGRKSNAHVVLASFFSYGEFFKPVVRRYMDVGMAVHCPLCDCMERIQVAPGVTSCSIPYRNLSANTWTPDDGTFRMYCLYCAVEFRVWHLEEFPGFKDGARLQHIVGRYICLDFFVNNSREALQVVREGQKHPPKRLCLSDTNPFFLHFVLLAAGHAPMGTGKTNCAGGYVQ